MKARFPLERVAGVSLLACLFAFVLAAPLLAADQPALPPPPLSPSPGPPLIVLSGILLSPTEAHQPNVKTLDLHVKDKTWSFEIENVKNLSGTETRTQLLESLQGRRLSLLGPDVVLRPLEKADMAGRQVHIKGIYNMSGRTLDVKSLVEDEGSTGAGSS